MKKQDALDVLDGNIYLLGDVAFSDALGCDINFEYNGYVADPQALLDCLGIDYNDYEDETELSKAVESAVDDWDISERLDGMEYQQY